MELSELHDCEKCHGKIVCITADKLGNTYCSYCGEKVNYTEYMRNELKEWLDKHPGVKNEFKRTNHRLSKSVHRTKSKS